MRTAMPRRVSHSASTSPVGPAPAMRTSVDGGGRVIRRHPPRRFLFFADEADGLGAGLGNLAQTDHARTFQLHAVAAHEGFLAVVGLDKRAVGALVDEDELVAAHLDARVQ